MYDEEGNLENNKYKPFWISFGKIKKYLKDEVYCTKDLGPLIHNCWTYWGHSGEPLFNFDGNIVGIHNSWNEKNGDRHGVSLLGIIKFISKYYIESEDGSKHIAKDIYLTKDCDGNPFY